MKNIFFIAFLLAARLCAESPQSEAIDRSQAFATEKIPEIQLKEVTVEQALEFVHMEWRKQHPSEAFPVARTDFSNVVTNHPTEPDRMTLELKNIPFLEAVLYICKASGRKLKQKGGLFQVTYGFTEEDWTTRTYEITSKELAGLHLKSNSSPSDVRRAFERFGVKFEDFMKLGVVDSGQVLVVTSCQTEHEQISGILFLLQQGFTIKK